MICIVCNKEYTKGYGSDTCSRSCCTRKWNAIRVKNGTCNLLKRNGGSELARKHNKDMAIKGIHPFQNMDEESLKKKAEGISKARIAEKELGTHIWQRINIRINNEYSIQLSKNKETTMMFFYIASTGNSEYFKLGVSKDSYHRSSYYLYPLYHLHTICKGDAITIITLERDLKRSFITQEMYDSNKSTEMFKLDDYERIVEFIDSRIKSSETRSQGRTSKWMEAVDTDYSMIRKDIVRPI